MPQWSNAPPPGIGRSGLRLLRTPTGKSLVATIYSDDLVGCPTHFMNNRTIPCEQDGRCEACDLGRPWRWHAYVACILEPHLERILFEVTAAGAESWIDYREAHGTLRGCKFKATRVNNRNNGRVIIVTRPADLAKIDLPEAADVPKLLCHIWNVSESAVDTVRNPERKALQVVGTGERGNGRPT